MMLDVNLAKSLLKSLHYLSNDQLIRTNKELSFLSKIENRATQSKNPLTQLFVKYFSQNDEDRILKEILERINLKNGTFVEFGPGNGLENNSIALLQNGWKGIWIGGEDLAIEIPKNDTLKFFKDWITLEKLERYLPIIKNIQPNFISMDLDGNDYYFMEYLLSNGINPTIIIQEYNGFFPFGIKWVQKYNPFHVWDGTNHYGASLQAYIELFEKYGYSLLCCNLTGVNSFFIKNSLLDNFPDISQINSEKFMKPLGYTFEGRGQQNLKIIQEIINNLE